MILAGEKMKSRKKCMVWVSSDWYQSHFIAMCDLCFLILQSVVRLERWIDAGSAMFFVFAV